MGGSARACRCGRGKGVKGALRQEGACVRATPATLATPPRRWWPGGATGRRAASVGRRSSSTGPISPAVEGLVGGWLVLPLFSSASVGPRCCIDTALLFSQSPPASLWKSFEAWCAPVGPLRFSLCAVRGITCFPTRLVLHPRLVFYGSVKVRQFIGRLIDRKICGTGGLKPTGLYWTSLTRGTRTAALVSW